MSIHGPSGPFFFVVVYFLYMAHHYRKHHRVSYFASSFAVVLGLVLIWRGIWHTLDAIDTAFFAGNHEITALVGIVLGFIVLYLPDHNLNEIRKL